MATLATFLQPESVSGLENHTLPTADHDNHHSEHVKSITVSLILAKIIAMATLGLVSFVIGMVPVKLASWLRYKDATKVNITAGNTGGGDAHHHGHHHSQPQPALISLLLCFGGGVLLYTTFLHLQPEVRESEVALKDTNKIPEWFENTHLSLSDFVFCCGFFFVYFVEESVHWLLDRNSQDQEDEEAALHRTMSLRRCSRRHYQNQHMLPNSGGSMIPRATLSAPVANGHQKSDSNDDSVAGSGSVSVSASTQGLLIRDQISIIDIKSTDHSPLDPQIRMFGGPLTAEEPMKAYKADNDDEYSRNSRVVAKSFRGFLAVLALSFHAVFEGLAVGLESSVPNVWYMFAAIATHKFVIAFCVGVELISSGTRFLLIVVYIGTFAIVTPLGIGIGLGLSDHEGSPEQEYLLLTTVLQGMAAGTLLYVIFFEVLQRERNSNNQSGALQLAAIIAGFCTMLFLQLALGHGHSHSHHHHHLHDHDHFDHITNDMTAHQGLNYDLHHDGDGHDHGHHFHNHGETHQHFHDSSKT